MSSLQRFAHDYAWALWLAAPLVITLLAALWLFWRGRARHAPGARVSIAAHHRYLDTLMAAPVGAKGAGNHAASDDDGANPPVARKLAS